MKINRINHLMEEQVSLWAKEIKEIKKLNNGNRHSI